MSCSAASTVAAPAIANVTKTERDLIMIISEQRVSGWSGKYSENRQWYQCPKCGNVTEDLTANDDGLWNCYACTRCFKLEEFGLAEVAVEVLRCSCGEEVSATPSNLCGRDSYLCASCENIVAVTFDGALRQPEDVFKMELHSGLAQRAVKISPELRAAEGANELDLVPIRLMRHFARKEHESFRPVDLNLHRCLILMCGEPSVICGYLLWSDEEGEATLRQLYVMPLFRHRGYAAALVQHWVSSYADVVGPRFAVEAPNEKSTNLLVKLGLVDLDNETRGKCYSVIEM